MAKSMCVEWCAFFSVSVYEQNSDILVKTVLSQLNRPHLKTNKPWKFCEQNCECIGNLLVGFSPSLFVAGLVLFFVRVFITFFLALVATIPKEYMWEKFLKLYTNWAFNSYCVLLLVNAHDNCKCCIDSILFFSLDFAWCFH